ncbi:MAG TPA: hypothetical protein VM716_02685 [Gemmatimonadales bacterium]|nr:hypothetical protein [Gemmatimonadales bacterium]
MVIGIVIGCGADRTILSPAAYARASATQHGQFPHHDEVLAELRTELRLSPDQAARVQEIFTAHQAEIDAAWAQVHESLQRAMQQTTAEIETVLDSPQVQRLHAWIAERHGVASGHDAAHHMR